MEESKGNKRLNSTRIMEEEKWPVIGWLTYSDRQNRIIP